MRAWRWGMTAASMATVTGIAMSQVPPPAPRRARCEPVSIRVSGTPGAPIDAPALRAALEARCGGGVVRDDAAWTVSVIPFRRSAQRVDWTLQRPGAPRMAPRRVTVQIAGSLVAELADDIVGAIERPALPQEDATDSGAVDAATPPTVDAASAIDAATVVAPDLPTGTPPSAWELRGDLGGQVDVGRVPGWSGGFHLGLALRWRRFSVLVEGRWVLERPVSTPGGEVDVGFVGGAVGPCVLFGPVGGCLLAHVGALHATHSNGARDSDWIALLGARLTGDLPLGAVFSLRGWAEVSTPLKGAALTVGPSAAESAVVWRSPSITGALGIGVGARFL